MAVSLELQVLAATGVAAAMTVTFTKQPGLTFYCTGIVVTGLGATAAGGADITFTGAKASPIITVPILAGVTTAITPFSQAFGEKGFPGVGQNTDFVVSCASFGSGNTKAQMMAWGYYA